MSRPRLSLIVAASALAALMPASAEAQTVVATGDVGNTQQTARGPLLAGEPGVETLATPADVDWYRFTPVGPTRFAVHVSNRSNTQSGACRVVRGELRDASGGTPSGFGGRVATSGSGSGASFGTAVEETQDLYLMVTGDPNEACDPAVSPAIYELAVFGELSQLSAEEVRRIEACDAAQRRVTAAQVDERRARRELRRAPARRRGAARRRLARRVRQLAQADRQFSRACDEQS